MFLFDTDHLTILKQGMGADFDALAAKLKDQSAEDLFISIVSFHEQLLGWNKYLTQAKDQTGLTRGYTQLENLLHDYSLAQVLPYDDAAAELFTELRRQRVRIGTMDLRIASIAISNGMALLTRNTVDFEKVPGLQFEDWTSH